MATYTINVTQSPLATGTIKIGSDLAQGNVQEEGVTVNLFATPISGYKFVSYVIDGGSPITTASHSFVMPSSDVNITLTFAELTVPTDSEQTSVYDTNCPRFVFIKDYNQRNFEGDVIDISATDHVQIEEPIGFGEGMFKLERDDIYHGFNYEFSVDSLRYELNSDGYTYLKEQILVGGTDSNIKFMYGFGALDAFTVFYVGKVDMNEYKLVENGEYAEFNIRELDFDNLLQTAFDVPQTVSLNEQVNLYSKVIPKKVEFSIEIPNDTLGIGLGVLSKAWFSDAYRTPDPPNTDIEAISKADPVGYCYFNDGREGDSDFETFATYDFQVDDPNPTGTDVEKYLLEVTEAGVYNIQVRFWMGLNFVLPINFTNLDFLELTLLVKDISGTITTLETLTPNSVFEPTALLDPDKIAVFNLDTQVELDLDSQLYLYIKIDTDNVLFPATGSISSIVAYPYEYDYNIPQISVVGQTIAENSTAKLSKPFDLINSACKQATDVDYQILKSDFFEEGGCGSLMYLTNGFNIRGVTDRDANVKPKEVIDMLANLYCLGWGVEYDEVNNDIIRLEPSEYFYQDVEILSLDNVSNYTKELDTGKYYNEIEVGFNKYSKQRETDKGFTLDDFHTKHYYQTPVKTNKNKLSIISDLILSAYEIEILRRKQFEKGGNSVDSNFAEDEELFGLQLASGVAVDTQVYPNAEVGDESAIILTINGAYALNLFIGDEVTYTSRAGVVQTRNVTSFNVTSYTISGTTFSVTFIGFAEALVGASTGAGDVTITRTSSESFLSPEGAQNFQVSDNLLSPNTTFNLRHTPKRMLYNWAKLLNGGFFTKVGTDQIIFKQGDGNTSLETQFVIGESCLLGGINRDLIVESGDVEIANFFDRGYLFLPFKVSFSTNLTFEQLTDLKRCLRGQDGTRDYGYITITNSCNETEKVFVTSISYNPTKDEAQIEGYLKEITGIV